MNNDKRYWYMDLDKTNKLDLLNWLLDDNLFGLVDEKKGGIVGYFHKENIQVITETLNDLEERLTKLKCQ